MHIYIRSQLELHARDQQEMIYSLHERFHFFQIPGSINTHFSHETSVPQTMVGL
jgi:hypothetical protein